jgi:hypothetical protein
MSKEVEKKTCVNCESSYKLIYDLDTTSGYPKWCPFCTAEIYNEDELSIDEED